MKFLKIVTKVLDAIIAFLFILTLFGIVLSSNVRSNVYSLGEILLSNGLIGIIILIYFLWIFRKIPTTITKLYKAKGFNSRFWNDL